MSHGLKADCISCNLVQNHGVTARQSAIVAKQPAPTPIASRCAGVGGGTRSQFMLMSHAAQAPQASVPVTRQLRQPAAELALGTAWGVVLLCCCIVSAPLCCGLMIAALRSGSRAEAMMMYRSVIGRLSVRSHFFLPVTLVAAYQSTQS